MKIYKWLNKYYDFLFGETGSGFLDSYYEGEVRILPLLFGIFILFMGLMFFLQWVYS